jgi:hypothetical protein
MRQSILLVPFGLSLLLTPSVAQTAELDYHAGEQASDAQRTSAAVGPKEGAETVFTKQAGKVVFLITRKLGEPHSLASGVILAADGYIATNYHALEGADAIEIRFFSEPGNSEDYTTFKAVKLLYADSDHDIAILKVSANTLPFLTSCPDTGDCRARVGQKVYAIGNPKGLSNTISEGIVSALRSLDNRDVIQHTAAISPGSSGGALVDSRGDLIGMNSWQVADGQNLNFAIPSKYLIEALSTARQSTTVLSFPPASAENSSETIADVAEQAFRSRDYIQAANRAELAIKSGFSDSRIYTILGTAKARLREEGQAERYLRQAILLSGPDDEYKQASRLGLLLILSERFYADHTSVDRLSFMRLIDDFLASKCPPIASDESYGETRKWAASLVPDLRSITGTWRDGSSAESLSLNAGGECGPEYIIGHGPNGQLAFRSQGPRPGSIICTIFGTVLDSGSGGFAGDLTRFVAESSGGALQHLRVEFTLSDDLTRLEGTAIPGAVAPSGVLGKLLADLWRHSGARWRFVLQRVE